MASPIYGKDGRYRGFVDDGYVYSRDGGCLGSVENGHVWRRDGRYVGELTDDMILHTGMHFGPIGSASGPTRARMNVADRPRSTTIYTDVFDKLEG